MRNTKPEIHLISQHERKTGFSCCCFKQKVEENKVENSSGKLFLESHAKEFLTKSKSLTSCYLKHRMPEAWYQFVLCRISEFSSVII